MLYIILFFATFFAVVLLTKSVFDILDKSSEEYKKKYVSQAVDDFESMFIYITPNQLFFLNIAITAIILIMAIMIFDTWTFRIIMAIIAFFIPGQILQWTEPIIKYITLLIIFVLVYDFVVRGDASTAAFLASFIGKTISKAVVILEQLSKEYTNQTIVENVTNTTPIIVLLPLLYIRK